MFVILSGAKDLLFDRVQVNAHYVLSVEPSFAQVFPRRIRGTDQYNFLLSQPTFDVFLSCDGVADLLEAFKVYKAMNTIFARESGSGVVLVFPRRVARCFS
jgi:hypothetical protein